MAERLSIAVEGGKRSRSVPHEEEQAPRLLRPCCRPSEQPEPADDRRSARGDSGVGATTSSPSHFLAKFGSGSEV